MAQELYSIEQIKEAFAEAGYNMFDPFGDFVGRVMEIDELIDALNYEPIKALNTKKL